MNLESSNTRSLWGVQEKLLSFFILMDVITVGALLYTVNQEAGTALKVQIREKLVQYSSNLLQDVETEMIKKFTLVTGLATKPKIQAVLKEHQPGAAPLILSSDEFDLGQGVFDPKIIITSASGDIEAKTPNAPNFNILGRPWTQGLWDGIFHVESYKEKDTSNILFAIPVRKSNRTIGTIVVIFDLGFVKQIAESKPELQAALLTSGSDLVLGSVPAAIISRIAVTDVKPGEPIIFEDEERFYCVYQTQTQRIPGLDWNLLLSSSKREVLEPLSSLKFKMIQVALLSVLLLSLAVILRVRTLIRPLKQLRNSMIERTENEASDRKVEVNSNDEIGELSKTFNNLLEELKNQRLKAVSSAKMAALGEMSAGVAHEINSPLMTISVSAGILEKNLASGNPKPDESAKLAKRIITTAERISKIVKGMRSFSRESAADPMVPVPVSALVSNTLELCSERFKFAGVDLRVEAIPDDLVISCRGPQIEQVILNLLNNAFDAIQGKPNPWITISAQATDGRANIRITDCGNGIPPEVREKIFSPFFTTKEMGKGTGLGLSISQRIIDEHRGALKIDETSPNTCFVIDIPLTQEAVVAKSENSEIGTHST